MRLIAEVMGRNKKLCWLRIPWGINSHRILTLPERVLPRGTKEARWVEAEIENVRERDPSGYTADVTVLGKSDDPREERPRKAKGRPGS